MRVIAGTVLFFFPFASFYWQ